MRIVCVQSFSDMILSKKSAIRKLGKWENVFVVSLYVILTDLTNARNLEIMRHSH